MMQSDYKTLFTWQLRHESTQGNIMITGGNDVYHTSFRILRVCLPLDRHKEEEKLKFLASFQREKCANKMLLG